MTTDTLHPLAADYLERLRRAARGLPGPSAAANVLGIAVFVVLVAAIYLARRAGRLRSS